MEFQKVLGVFKGVLGGLCVNSRGPMGVSEVFHGVSGGYKSVSSSFSGS